MLNRFNWLIQTLRPSTASKPTPLEDAVNATIKRHRGKCKLLYIPNGNPEGSFRSGNHRIYVITKNPQGLFYIQKQTGKKIQITVEPSFFSQIFDENLLGNDFEMHPALSSNTVVTIDSDNNPADSTENQSLITLSTAQFNNILNLIYTYELKNFHLDNSVGNNYHALQISAGKMRIAFLEKIKSIIDEDIYEQEFLKGKTDKKGHYVIPENDNHLSALKKVHNLIKQLEKIFNDMIPVQIQLMESNTYWKYAKSSPNLIYNVTKVLETYKELNLTLESLQLFPFLSKLNSFEDLKKQIKQAIPFSSDEIISESTQNPFYQYYVNKKDDWINLKKSSVDKLECVKAILSREEFDVRQESIDASIKQISGILKLIERFNASSGSLRDLIYFIYKIYPEITNLMSSFPQSMVSLKNLLNEHLVVTAEQINLILKDIFLQFDAAEIKYHLKEGLLCSTEICTLSINKVAKEFSDSISALGYEFKEADRYPYLEAINHQRTHICTENLPLMDAELIQNRKASIERRIQENNINHTNARHALREKYKSERIRKINRLIQERIDVLTIEKKSWFNFTKTKDNKITALRLLENQLSSGKTLTETLNSILSDNDPTIRKLSHNLIEGRTASLVRKIALIESKPDDRIELIKNELSRLEINRQQGFYFFATKRRVSLEKRIRALKQLKSLLNQPGYTLDIALAELSVKFPDHSKIIASKEKTLLDTIHEIDANLTNKTSVATFTRDPKIRKHYPQNLCDVEKIEEHDNLDGSSYRDIYFNDDTIRRERLIANKPSIYAIKDLKIKNPSIAITQTAGADIGKIRIDHRKKPATITPETNSAIKTLVHEKIRELKTFIKNNFFFTDTAKKQVQLLIELNSKLNTTSFQDALDSLAESDQFASTYPLLWMKDVGDLMNRIEKSEEKKSMGKINMRN